MAGRGFQAKGNPESDRTLRLSTNGDTALSPGQAKLYPAVDSCRSSEFAWHH
ncbi:MAG: hypothetical protein ACKO2P_11505 [Planctomycetota bacterium]